MRWPWQREKRSGDYSQRLLDAHLSAAASKTATAAQTAAIETVAGALSRALAGAEVEGDGAGAITPEWLALCGREIIRRGQHVSFIHPSLALVPVDTINWEDEADGIQGELERGWRARITTYGPSTSRTRIVSRDQIIVIRWGNSSGRPYDGQAAHHFASLAARASAESERAAGDDAASPVTNFITVPEGQNQDDDSDPLAPLRESIADAKGKALVVESTHSGYGEGRGNAPQRDFSPQRLGPSPSPDQVEAAKDAYTRMLASCGMPIAMFSATTAQSAREGLRQWHMGTVQPVTRLIESELSRRLDSPIRLKLDTYGLDIAGRASAFKSLVAGGMDLQQAASISGVLADDG